MKYTYEIISLIGWPILIYISYKASMFFIDKFEKNIEKETKNEKSE